MQDHSKYTAKERKYPSYPAKYLFKNGLIKGTVLDFGCGFGRDVEYLKEQGFSAAGYDPAYYPQYPEVRFDTVLCNYVLNVLEEEAAERVIMQVSTLLKPAGKAYFTVRRDIKKDGEVFHIKHKLKTYQRNVVLPFKSIHLSEHCEIYEFNPVKSVKNKSECPFCRLGSAVEVIAESSSFFAIYDKYPVSRGHALIISKRHTASFFDLNTHEKFNLMLFIDYIKVIVNNKHNPDGYNIGINIGKDAGQSVFHFHAHLIPRYKGDVKDPKGGVRHIIPGKGYY